MAVYGSGITDLAVAFVGLTLLQIAYNLNRHFQPLTPHIERFLAAA